MRKMLIAALAATVLGGTLGAIDALAGQVTLAGGVTLTLPDDRWPDAGQTTTDRNGVAETTAFLFDEGRNERVGVALVATQNLNDKLGNVREWFIQRQVPEFLMVYAEGAYNTPTFREIERTPIVLQVGGVPSFETSRLKLSINGNERSVVWLYFLSPNQEYRYALFVFGVGTDADVASVLPLVAGGISWSPDISSR